MSYHHHHHTTIQKNDTVWACAWCDPETYAPLKRGQEYTHGICKEHKQKLMNKTIRMFIKRHD